MKIHVVTASLLCILIGSCQAALTKQSQRKFPDDFKFGTATASYQIEGGWNADGKGESIWDRVTHRNPQSIADFSSGDVTSDSYHQYKRDVETMRELGLNAYRFSISWSRILPTGMPNEINPAGIEYYNNLINEMLKYNIEPFVTLYHWDLPQKLQDLGGFTNPLFPQWYEDYARIVFENFGDRVKLWLTFNEPREICFEGYGDNTKAPQLNAHGIGEYLCAKNLILAHARAYHMYNNEFKPKYGGECGITISVNWFEADTNSEEDERAAELKRQVEWGLYAVPIFSKEGGFPKELAAAVEKKSLEQGYLKSRLPELSEEEKNFIKGAYDFMGVNHYSTNKVSATKGKSKWSVPSIYDDADVGAFFLDEWPMSASSWLRQAPDSIYHALTHLKNKFNDPVIYITENGFTTRGGLEDDDRIQYYRAAWESALNALDAGVRLKGYMAWTLMDNFEWNAGFTERFGLYEVDFQDPERTRTPRKSAFVYKELIKTKIVDYSYEPDITSLQMTIDAGH